MMIKVNKYKLVDGKEYLFQLNLKTQFKQWTMHHTSETKKGVWDSRWLCFRPGCTLIEDVKNVFEIT